MTTQVEMLDSLTITLDRTLINMIFEFNGHMIPKCPDWGTNPNLATDVHWKLYEILRDAHEMNETAKRELEGYFTDDEALLLFVCLFDGMLGYLRWEKPERDFRKLIDYYKDTLLKFYGGAIPMDTVSRVCMKVGNLTPSQCNALIKMSHDMRRMTEGDILRFSTDDIAHHFRTSGPLTEDKCYEIKID